MDPVDVDLVDVVALTRALSDIDSTTGREAETGQLLAAILRERGYDVQEQPVDGGRFNVFATLGQSPQVVFSTHYDCVPPFFPTRLENGMLFGRGVCDAKGILAAQVAATERMRLAGEQRVGLLLFHIWLKPFPFRQHLAAKIETELLGNCFRLVVGLLAILVGRCPGTDDPGQKEHNKEVTAPRNSFAAKHWQWLPGSGFLDIARYTRSRRHDPARPKRTHNRIIRVL